MYNEVHSHEAGGSASSCMSVVDLIIHYTLYIIHCTLYIKRLPHPFFAPCGDIHSPRLRLRQEATAQVIKPSGRNSVVRQRRSVYCRVRDYRSEKLHFGHVAISAVGRNVTQVAGIGSSLTRQHGQFALGRGCVDYRHGAGIAEVRLVRQLELATRQGGLAAVATRLLSSLSAAHAPNGVCPYLGLTAATPRSEGAGEFPAGGFRQRASGLPPRPAVARLFEGRRECAASNHRMPRP